MKRIVSVNLFAVLTRPVPGRKLKEVIDAALLMLGRELVPGRVARYACRLGMAHEVVLRFFPCRRLHHLDGPGAHLAIAMCAPFG